MSTRPQYRPRARAPHRGVPMTRATDLLRLLDGLPADLLVGFEPSGQGVALHVGAFPTDERHAAAGLFALSAPREWAAVGIVLTGAARELRPAPPRRADPTQEAEQGRPADVVVRVVLTRTGDLGAVVAHAPGAACAGGGAGGTRTTVPAPRPTSPEGLLVDALHRMLGLASPGEPPEVTDAVLHLWVEDVMAAALRHGGLDRTTALALHPAASVPGSRALRHDAPPDEVAQLTRGAAQVLDWGRLRRRAVRGDFRVPELSVAEAGWMDDTCFGRWVLGSVPELSTMLTVIAGTGSAAAADLLTAVCHELRGEGRDDGRSDAPHGQAT